MEDIEWEDVVVNNDNLDDIEWEDAKPVTQSVMDDRDGQVYNVPLAYDGVDTRFAIDTQHKGADKGSFFGKVFMDVSKMTTALTTSDILSRMLPDNISFEGAKDLARGLVGSAEGFVDNKLVEATDLRQKQRIAAGKMYQMSTGDPLRDMAFDWEMPTEEEQEEAKKLVETAQKIRDANKKWWNDTKEAIKAEETMDEADKFIEALGGGIGSMGFSIGSMLAFKNPTVGSAIIASEYGKMAGNQFFDEAVKNGMDFDMAYTLALGRGGIEGGIELVADTTLAKIANLKAMQDISNRVISSGLIKAAQSKLGKSAIQKMGTRHANSVFGAVVKGFGSEGGTEALQQSLGMFYDNAAGIADYSLDQILGETLFASVIGGITGGLGAGSGTLAYNRQVVDTNERIKKVLQEQTPDLTAEETQTMADALQEMLYQESTGYMNELNNVMEKELAPDARQEGLTPEQLTTETRKLLKEKYKMSDEDINKTIQSALSVIDARNQFNEAYAIFSEGLANAGRDAARADGEARVLAARALSVARAQGTQVKDVLDRWNLQFRQTAWNEADVDNARYQESMNIAIENAELDKVNPAYEGEAINIDGVERTVYNSNGDRIAMSEPALRNFYKWFGDSKVVDKEGRPLVVYHGTNAEFDAFDKSKQKRSLYGKGFYFTDTIEWAKQFISPISWKNIKDNDKRVMPLYLSMNKPYITDKINNDAQELQEQGYDGIIVKHYDTKYLDDNPDVDIETAPVKDTTYIAFEPNQIKSTSNEGSFSELADNIYLQETTDAFPRVEMNAVTARDPERQNYMKEQMLKNGWTEDQAEAVVESLDRITNVIESIADKHPNLKEQLDRGEYVVFKPDFVKMAFEEEHLPLTIMSNKKTLGLLPRISAFKKNGDYTYNVDFGTTCTKREPLEAAVKMLIHEGFANKLGSSQLQAIKDILMNHGYEFPCRLCFVEGKRTKELNSAQRFSRHWNYVIDAVGIKGDQTIGESRTLTDEQISKLEEIKSGKGYEKYIPEEFKSGKEDKDKEGITKDRAKKVAARILEEYKKLGDGTSTLANRMTPDMLLNSEGTDYIFAKYADLAPALRGMIASRDGAGTAKPHESQNVYDTYSFKEMFDRKKNPENIVKMLYEIGGVRMQSFTDFNVYMVLDYIQMLQDLAIRHMPAHAYTKVPSFVELFGEFLNVNMSLIGSVERGVSEEYAGLRKAKKGEKVVYSDHNGDWTYNWAVESFDPQKAFALRKEDRFKGKVGTIAVGISDKHIEALLNDPEIDMVIPFHKSGIENHILYSAGLQGAKDYSDTQNTGGLEYFVDGKKKKKKDYMFNKKIHEIGNARDTAKDYLRWCEKENLTPKFDQFKNNENYYKLLEDFRSYDNNGNPVLQEAVSINVDNAFYERLKTALEAQDELKYQIDRMSSNESLMQEFRDNLKYERVDGELRDIMLSKLEKALGSENVAVLSQVDFFEELEKTNPEEAEMFRNKTGALYGFTRDGKIYLNLSGFNAHTPAHEFSHVWDKVLQKVNKDLWNKGVELLKQTQEWKDVVGDDLYKNIRNNDNAIASEALARIVGEMNEEIAREFQDPNKMRYKGNTLKDKIMRFILDMWDTIRSMFDPKYTGKDITSAREFARMTIQDLWDDGRAKDFRKALASLSKSETEFNMSNGSNQATGPRGAYHNSIIYLFENADASTVIHELGHFFLDDMQKFANNETTKAQLEAIYKYVGSTDGNLTPEQHEYFANSFEVYLLEGRAPNKTLEKVFWNFRNWISRIWSEIKRLSGIKLTPEIRKVFDEMLGGRGLDFAMQMSGARMAEALESGTIPPNVIAKAIELLETGKMSRADMDDLIARMKTGDLKRKDFNQELKKFENSNVKHGERLDPFDKVKYKEALARGNFSKKDVLEKINRLLKWTEPRSQNGKVVGRFSNLKMNQEFDHIRELMNMEKAQAKEMLDRNIKLINAMIKGEVAIKEKDRSPDDHIGEMERLVFDNKILTIRLNKANASLLLDVYNAISDSYNMGRLTTAITGEARRARKNRLVNEAVHVLTADGDVDWRRERGKLKQFVNQLGTSQMSWQGILDILSMNDKTSKTGQSLLVQNLDVFDAQQKEAQGLAEDGEKASRFMEKKLKGVGNAAISVSRYVNSKLDEKFTIQWGANKKTFTKDQLLDIYMKAKDEETRKMMVEDPILQYNERFLSEVNEILTAEDRAIAEALFEFYDDNYAKINAFYEEKYGTSLGKRAFYSPRSMDRGGINVDSGDLSSYAGFSGVKERKAKAGAVKIKGAFQVLQDYIVNSNHWIAWSDKLIDINAVMGDVEVKNIIRNLFGEGMEKRIGYEVSRMASNDKFQSKFGYGKLFNKIRSNYAIAALAAKPSLMIKQLTSFPAYWEHMSTAEFMSGLADFAIHMKEAVETLGNTTLMKTRDVNIIKDFEELSKSELFKKNANKVKLRELLMANIKLGDRGAIYMGGWALYKAELKKNLAKGMSEEKAKALALEKFERVTDETQQSGRLSQQSYWQSNPFLRAFTMFQSSQNQYLRKEINAIRGLATGRMDKKQALKTLFIFHVLLPCFFQYASDGFDWDEKAQLRAALLGSLNGIFILNGILERGLDYALGTADAWKATSTALSDVLPFWGSGEDLAKFFIDLAEGDIDLEDYVEVIRAFGKPVGELTGIPVKYPLDVIQNFGSYAEEGEVKKEVLLWLGWSPYALRDKEED